MMCKLSWQRAKHLRPQDFSLTKTMTRLLRANVVLTKDPMWPYCVILEGELHKEGSWGKAAGVLSSRVLWLNLVLEVGVISDLPM